MAGGYGHITSPDGELYPVKDWGLENGGDYVEAITQMWGMIQVLADAIANSKDRGTRHKLRLKIIEKAERQYQRGIQIGGVVK